MVIVIYDTTIKDKMASFTSVYNKLRQKCIPTSEVDRSLGIIRVLNVNIYFRCGKVERLQGLRPNYYLSYGYEAQQYLEQAAYCVNGKEVSSEDDIVKIVESRVIELEKEKEKMKRMSRLGRNVTLKTCELVEENDLYYLHLIYGYEDDYGVYELHIPRMILPIRKDKAPTVVFDEPNGFSCPAYKSEFMSNPPSYADFDGQKFELLQGEVSCKDLNGDDILTRAKSLICVLLEKKQEMTLEEIEKKLGYKVKIVSEKEK